MGKNKTHAHRNPAAYANDLIDLSIVLTRLRERAGVSQDELAVMARVEKYTISNMENASGSPTLMTISKIFDALGYTITDAYAQIEAYNVRFD